MPTISVIVPVYKVEKYINRCVDSILEQTYADFELILVDDGSPDNCGAICDEYAAKDSRVVVIHQENGGLSAARNAAIDWAFANSDSRWITFIDSDDQVYRQYLDRLLTTVVSQNADIAVCGLVAFQTTPPETPPRYYEGTKGLTSEEACLQIYLYDEKRPHYVNSSAKLYKKELFRNIRFPKGKLHEDQYTTYRIMYEANRIAEIGEKVYCYYTNPSSILRSEFSLRRYDDLYACEEAYSFFVQRGKTRIAAAVEEKIKLIIALYGINARKAGVYRMIPSKYKISFLNAVNTIKKLRGQDFYEQFMVQYYPGFLKFDTYFHKIFRILQGEEKISSTKFWKKLRK